MNLIEKNCLVEFFQFIDDKYEYVVMRNAGELPFENHSNDIDILIDKREYKYFEKAMFTVLLKNGYSRVERTSFHGIECYTFYNIEQEAPLSIKFDLFFNYEGGGVLYFNFSELIKNKTRNENGIYIFDEKIESYLTIYKSIAAGGISKDKYIQNFLHTSNGELPVISKLSISKTIDQHISALLKTGKVENEISRKKILIETLFSNLKKQPFKSFYRVFTHVRLEISRSFKKQYMFAFVGPDGSGKTTLVEHLIGNSKHVFRSDANRFNVLHHRPHVLPNISNIFKPENTEKENFDLHFNPHSGEPSRPIVSFFKILYYAVDYRFGYIKNQLSMQRHNKFIIYDRYFYDFIVDQKRSAVRLNKKITILIFKVFIPKPNMVFVIRVNAKEAHNRKKELPVETIDRINNEYSKLSKELKHFETIMNDDLKRSTPELMKKFIIQITRQVSN